MSRAAEARRSRNLPGTVVAALGTALALALVAAVARAAMTWVLRGVLAVLPRSIVDTYMAQVVWAPFLADGLAYGVAVGLAWLLAAGAGAGLAGNLVTLAAWGGFAAWFALAGGPASPTGRALAGAASGVVVAGAGSFVAGMVAGRARARGSGVGPGRAWGFHDVFAAGFAGMLATAVRPSALTLERLATALALAALAGLAGVQGARVGERRAVRRA